LPGGRSFCGGSPQHNGTRPAHTRFCHAAPSDGLASPARGPGLRNLRHVVGTLTIAIISLSASPFSCRTVRWRSWRSECHTAPLLRVEFHSTSLPSTCRPKIKPLRTPFLRRSQKALFHWLKWWLRPESKWRFENCLNGPGPSSFRLFALIRRPVSRFRLRDKA